MNTVAPTNQDVQNAYLSSSTPAWMIAIDNLLSSPIVGFEQFTQLHQWSTHSQRFTVGDQTSNAMTSASVRHAAVEVMIANGGHGNILESAMYDGKKIEKITIVRLGHMDSILTKMSEVIFGMCRIQHFEIQQDQIRIAFSMDTKMSTTFVFDENGRPKGQTVLSFDFTKNANMAI
jgi:hypothetical protein